MWCAGARDRLETHHGPRPGWKQKRPAGLGGEGGLQGRWALRGCARCGPAVVNARRASSSERRTAAVLDGKAAAGSGEEARTVRLVGDEEVLEAQVHGARLVPVPGEERHREVRQGEGKEERA